MTGEAEDQSTDASQWEYTTYAPRGETCPVCIKVIGTLEPVRRGTLQRAPGTSEVTYRHHGKCPV